MYRFWTSKETLTWGEDNFFTKLFEGQFNICTDDHGAVSSS